jgi:HSP20 family protein
MADVKIDKQHETQSGSQSTGMQASGQRGGLARRHAWSPSLFSLSPRDFFSSSPFEIMRRFSEEMDRAFEDFGLSREWGEGRTGSSVWSPAVEVFERENNLIIRAELPGLTSDDVKVEMTDGGLVIQGERKYESEEKNEGWYRSERSYGRFYRLIPLPEGVNAERAKARFENGVLEISAPLPESKRSRRSIPIETGTETTQRSQTAGSSSGRNA